jgi:hypothetical protein
MLKWDPIGFKQNIAQNPWCSIGSITSGIVETINEKFETSSSVWPSLASILLGSAERTTKKPR